MRKLLTLTAALLFINICSAQTSNTIKDTTLPDLIIVRIVETLSFVGGQNGQSEMIIYYGSNKSETIDLNNLTAKGYPITNMEKIHIVIQRLFDQQYTLIATYSSGGGQSLIFKREKQLKQ